MHFLGILVNIFVESLLVLCEGNRLAMTLFRILVLVVELMYNMVSNIFPKFWYEYRLRRYALLSKKLHSETKLRLAIVTGANRGIGYETAKTLALAGYHVILACRNSDSAASSIESLQKQTKLQTFEFMQLDLSCFKSIRAFILNYKLKYNYLDLLVNNAGVMVYPRTFTKDGLELHFGTNHIGHFMLTNGLINNLLACQYPKIVIVSSVSHYNTSSADFEFLLKKNLHEGFRNCDSLHYKHYDPAKSYSLSKLCNIMFAQELARRYKHTNLLVNSLHPGITNTNLGRLNNQRNGLITRIFKSFFAIFPAQGALTSIKLALSPDGNNGKYFARESETSPLPLSQNEDICLNLWNYSEQIIKDHSCH
ncbi:Short-chain dehydrogenase TIC 32, chloroplastic [Smittium mucronatum]|uniref:Short-chain dehydrogenase TIC 32, chloroplastic n=1 Tax=Smittium mucronatum TaxID=133383 RepID=A0A1R0H8R7_9FUNG|nr:Short-chain dehydrogenase TIC 32, chloroplastic [Smittium mucronatum]